MTTNQYGLKVPSSSRLSGSLTTRTSQSLPLCLMRLARMPSNNPRKLEENFSHYAVPSLSRLAWVCLLPGLMR